MSACTCCPEVRELPTFDDVCGQVQATSKKVTLFNWVTVLLITGWVGIVTVAMQLADRNDAALLSLETFISSLL